MGPPRGHHPARQPFLGSGLGLGVRLAGDITAVPEPACARHIVESLDGMTADWGDLDHQLLRRISNRSVDEACGIDRAPQEERQPQGDATADQDARAGFRLQYKSDSALGG